MAKLKYTLTRDTLFKILFVQNKGLLKNLVSQILDIALKDIREFKVTNPEITPEDLGGKFCVLDIKMKVNGQIVNLEVQVRDKKNYPERSLFYWAQNYTKELKESENYINLKKTIGINIIEFDLFKDTKDIHSEFRALEVTRHTELTDKMSLHYFELKKLPKITNSDAKNALKLWLSLFKAKTDEEMEKIANIGGRIMKQAVTAYKNVVVSDTFQEAERVRQKARLNEAYALRNAMNKGIAKGKTQGKAEGKAEGITQGVRQTAKNMKNMGIDTKTIAKATKMTVDDILKL